MVHKADMLWQDSDRGSFKYNFISKTTVDQSAIKSIDKTKSEQQSNK